MLELDVEQFAWLREIGASFSNDDQERLPVDIMTFSPPVAEFLRGALQEQVETNIDETVEVFRDTPIYERIAATRSAVLGVLSHVPIILHPKAKLDFKGRFTGLLPIAIQGVLQGKVDNGALNDKREDLQLFANAEIARSIDDLRRQALQSIERNIDATVTSGAGDLQALYAVKRQFESFALEEKMKAVRAEDPSSDVLRLYVEEMRHLFKTHGINVTTDMSLEAILNALFNESVELSLSKEAIEREKVRLIRLRIQIAVLCLLGIAWSGASIYFGFFKQ